MVLQTVVWYLGEDNSHSPYPGPKAQRNNPQIPQRGELWCVSIKVGSYTSWGATVHQPTPAVHLLRSHSRKTEALTIIEKKQSCAQSQTSQTLLTPCICLGSFLTRDMRFYFLLSALIARGWSTKALLPCCAQPDPVRDQATWHSSVGWVILVLNVVALSGSSQPHFVWAFVWGLFVMEGSTNSTAFRTTMVLKPTTIPQ